ncbi:malto-oligosyltrehalose trehalohydrolase [Carbonactinospora thermoautotrophica]|uniref:Malto-oligosyltrehalose trehalohydrolase n=1 Tax=Carbonactinospora thermoautotrophica TaxID=1469144 RepID=A0A132N2L8_9ACTN|nr:malto-oligosyltrehalose trehalohydrolase [Carbonactinospora thermoautotrophica]KWX04334.1 malto-oligosyltrehalose trehalohydrolase [Carbonactinospora thermoautotrophica]KWX04935.1 malto-oligosyltrehalose trehalohydrolase [Carbonactinospora thermoautotrophica]
MSGFSVWAPYAGQVEIEIGGKRYRMRPGRAPGWWRAEVPEARHGTDYVFRLDGGEPLPDPRSPWQPHGVHGPSRFVDHSAFPWTDRGWTGRPLPGGVVYELHIGTFTPEGTFDAAIGRLDHLVDLGVTHVEVMPVNAFPGRHGWGYDGVGLWAVHDPYGGPDGFKRFVDACHGRGLAVILDVVYNHLGPGGNYLARFGPYFTDRGHTPWGPAVNLEGSDEVRRFVVENALYWLREYHVDGLRLDAVHALVDTRRLLEELAVQVEALATAQNRPLTLIAESDPSDPRLVTPREAGGYGLHAQWNDDFHHALRSLLTGERHGYHGDCEPLPALAKALTGGHDASTFRARRHGRPVDTRTTPAHRFVCYLQNHDQVGNRAAGDRLSATLRPEPLKIGAALLLTAPFTPMLFMGEEWAASTPWQYFTDHPEPELAQAVREGRRAESAGWDPTAVPDPQDERTFQRSKLDWREKDRDEHAAVLRWYRRLIALRRRYPQLADPWLDRVHVVYDEENRWLVVSRGRLRVAVNLSPEPRKIPLDAIPVGVCAVSVPGFVFDRWGIRLAPESVAVVETLG